MRNSIYLILGLLALSVGCKDQNGPAKAPQAAASADTGTRFHRYGIEHAHFQFEFVGDARGVEDLYFDHFGDRETRISNFEHIGDKKFEPVHVIKIQNGGNAWILQTDKKSGMHFFNKEFDSLMQADRDQHLTSSQASENVLKAQGDLKSGTDTVHGLTTDVWISPDGSRRLYLWNAILVKSDAKHNDEEVMSSPILIDTTTAIDTGFFSPPPGFQIEESEPPAGKH